MTKRVRRVRRKHRVMRPRKPREPKRVIAIVHGTSPRLWIPYAAPNLNDLFRARGAGPRGRAARGPYDKLKRAWMDRIVALAAEQGIARFANGARVRFTMVEKNKRRDPDNISSGAAKFILDGLVACGVLPDDGWKGVKPPLVHDWRVVGEDMPTPGVLVELEE